MNAPVVPLKLRDPTAGIAGVVGHVEVAIWPENNSAWALQVTSLGEVFNEPARSTIKAQDRLELSRAAELPCADVEVVVMRTEENAKWLVETAAVLRDDDIYEVSRGRVVAQYIISGVVGHH